MLDHPLAVAAGVTLLCKRDDLYAFEPGSPLQGNKIRKLCPYLSDPAALEGRVIVSFGGAYSNHLAALSAASRRYGFSTRFIIRGEPISNPTLAYCRRNGSTLQFVTRSAYRRKNDPDFRLSVGIRADEVVIPEGGSSPDAVISTGAAFTETVKQLGAAPDYFCLSAGTGCTAAGIVRNAADSATAVEVFPALRGDWMRTEIERWAGRRFSAKKLRIILEYTYGGYGKFASGWKLYTPAGQLAKRADIGIAGLPPLEPVYTAKLFSGVLDRLKRGVYPPGATVVLLHTGGIY